MQKLNDEYVWENYPQEYSQQLEEIKKNDNQDFFITDFEKNYLSTNSPHINEWNKQYITFKDNLHNNWKELYDIAFLLNPKSVFECGFGAGYHLYNLHKVLPEAEVFGCDLLEGQLKKCREFSNLPESILNKLFLANLADPNLFTKIEKPQAEFVYSQAVVMHQSTQNAINMMRNMAAISTKYIFMVEGVKNHDNWYELVKNTLPEFEFKQVQRFNGYIDYAVLMTRK